MPPRTIKEKIREALLAIKLEQTLTKDQILARYLNTIYLGHGAYGVQAAAQTYWGIDAADLSVKQSATLAGLITSPSRFDPIDHPAGREGQTRLRARPDGAATATSTPPTADRLKTGKVLDRLRRRRS